LINHNILLCSNFGLINDPPQAAESCEYRSLETESKWAYQDF
jgi:hypothetical protein